MCNIRPCSILYTDDAFKESIFYAAIFLVLFILTVLLCAAIFYKLRKCNENACPVEPTDGNENTRLVEPTDGNENTRLVEPTDGNENTRLVEPTDGNENTRLVEPTDGNENTRLVKPTDGNENAPLFNDRDEECQVRKVYLWHHVL